MPVTLLVVVGFGDKDTLFSVILEGELGLCMEVILIGAWLENTGLGMLGTFFEFTKRIFFFEFYLDLVYGEVASSWLAFSWSERMLWAIVWSFGFSGLFWSNICWDNSFWDI